MSLAEIFDIDQDIVQIYNNKDIKLFGKDFVNIILKSDQKIGKTKSNDLVLKVPISSIKSYFPLITFSDLYLMICIS